MRIMCKVLRYFAFMAGVVAVRRLPQLRDSDGNHRIRQRRKEGKMENLKRNCREWVKNCFEGEITLTKVDLWLIALVCLMAGTLRGLKKAPATHGVMIGSNNGNTFGCGTGEKKSPEENGRGKEMQEENAKESRCGGEGREKCCKGGKGHRKGKKGKKCA